MSLRKLLIVTYHFPPSAAIAGQRFLGAVRHLEQFGWRAVVVSPPRLPWEPVDPALLDQVPAEVPLYHAPYPSGWLGRPLRRLAPMGCWLPFALATTRRAIREHRPDAVWTSAPPPAIHLLGRWIHRRYGLPWVAGFRDPWVAANWLREPDRPARRWEVKTEAAVVREADLVLANSARFRAALADWYPEHAAKLVTLSNGYEPDSYPSSPAPPLDDPARVRLVHTGTIYANRDPVGFLDALDGLEPAQLPGGRRLEIELIGKVEQRPQELDRAIARFAGTGTARLLPQVPHAQALEAMVGADVLLLLDSPGRHLGVPAKLYEYLGAGRPILAVAEPNSDVQEVLAQSGRPYRIASPADPAAIRRALLELLREVEARGPTPPDPSRPERFTREHLAGELADHLGRIVPPRAHRPPAPGPHRRPHEPV